MLMIQKAGRREGPGVERAGCKLGDHGHRSDSRSEVKGRGDERPTNARSHASHCKTRQHWPATSQCKGIGADSGFN